MKYRNPGIRRGNKMKNTVAAVLLLGPNLPQDDGLPLGPDRQVGPRKGTVRNPHGHHRHPGNALRREGMGAFLSMSAIELGKRVPV